jgi:biofilm protein TabA
MYRKVHMIYDKIANASAYKKILPQIIKAAKFASKIGKNAEDGRYEIDGNRIFAIVSTYPTKMDRSLPFEGHRKYIDFQCLLSGEERIDIVQGKGFKVTQKYSAKKDIYFIRPLACYSSIILTPGTFAIFHPQDLHRPGQGITKSSPARKLVIKIRGA